MRLLRALRPAWSSFHGASPRARPWLALVMLGLLFDAPLLLLPSPARPTGELWLVVVAFVLSSASRLRRALHLALGGMLAALVLIRIDRVVFRLVMKEEPLLYDQLFLLRHLFVLVGDLLSPGFVAGLVGLAVAGAMLLWVVRALLRSVAELADPARRFDASRGFAALTVVCALGTALPPLCSARPVVEWMLPRLADNMARSRRVYDAVHRSLERSPYARYAKLELARRPDVWLVFVESYGRFLADDPGQRRFFASKLRRMQQRLARAGWSAASAFSRAPISGGRSWLAEASVLMGSRVRYEAVFHHLVREIARVPNLVSFFAGQGYETVLLAPADRVRPGVEEVNRYGYDRSIRFDDLEYAGEHIGWGLVPDQYSLGYTHEHVLSAIERPVFFDFHMVSSHAPWQEVPRLLADYRSAGRTQGDGTERDSSGPHEILKRMRRYGRSDSRFAWMGKATWSKQRDYRRAVFYSLSVLERKLVTLNGERLVIVMGDHQPPLIDAHNRSYDVPVHVLSRDPELLREFEAHGFRPGIFPPTEGSTELRHEGLFSLIVRALAAYGGERRERPPYLAQGATLVR